MSQSKIYGWSEMFKGWRTRFVREESSGRSSIVKCVEVKEKIHQHIRENLGINIDEISSESSIGH